MCVCVCVCMWMGGLVGGERGGGERERERERVRQGERGWVLKQQIGCLDHLSEAKFDTILSVLKTLPILICS